MDALQKLSDALASFTILPVIAPMPMAAQSSLNWVSIMLLAGGGLGALIALWSLRRRPRAAASARGASSSSAALGAGESADLRDLSLLLDELDGLARRMHGSLDTRFAELEAILRQADQRIERLSRLIRSAEGGPALDVTVDDAPPPPGTLDDRHAAVYKLADQGLTAAQIARELRRNDGEVELILSLRKVRHSLAGDAAAPPSATQR